MSYFSVIVPVYNRPGEVADLLTSLEGQTRRDLVEVVLVEDGSTVPCCRQAADSSARGLNVQYHFKANEGRSIARNYGMARAGKDTRWYVFFDSDCVIPPTYFADLYEALKDSDLDCYGGPDAAHDTFTPMQKAINYAMTAFLTTGGIRGGRVSLESFKPRTFNMGIRREVIQKVGGFREMFSEDIDMSTRIRQAGYRIGLLRQVPVWHKRRVNLRKFWRQVHIFGRSRITLQLLYPGSLKLVHALPSVAVIGLAACIVLSVTWSWWWMAPVGAYLAALLIGAYLSTRSVGVALRAVPAGVVQIVGYGTGFIRAFVSKILLRRGRDVQQEIELRRGR